VLIITLVVWDTDGDSQTVGKQIAGDKVPHDVAEKYGITQGTVPQQHVIESL